MGYPYHMHEGQSKCSEMFISTNQVHVWKRIQYQKENGVLSHGWQLFSSPSACEQRCTGAASAVAVDIVSEARYNTAGVGLLHADDSLLVSRAVESLLANIADEAICA